MKELISRLIDLGARILGWAISVMKIIWEWFLHVSFFEKAIVLNTIPAFFAVTMDAYRYRIYDSWDYYNNPLAVYLIGIVMIMLGISALNFYANKWGFLGRLGVNIWYIISAVYYLATDSLTHARPYEVTGWFYLNFVVPGIYILFSILSFLSRR